MMCTDDAEQTVHRLHKLIKVDRFKLTNTHFILFLIYICLLKTTSFAFEEWRLNKLASSSDEWQMVLVFGFLFSRAQKLQSRVQQRLCCVLIRWFTKRGRFGPNSAGWRTTE